MADSALAERITDRSRLTRAEVGALLNLHRAGKTQVEIAQALGIDQSNVSRWLDKLIDTTELAKHTLKNSANALAERVAKRADVDQSLEVLDRLEVLPKREQAGNRTGVQINIGMPGLAAGLDPLEAGNHKLGYRTQTISEGQQHQQLTATIEATNQAKVEGESL